MQNQNDTENHLISVIIPLYNHRNTIGKCIESIQAQTYPNIEIIVVNDGSDDDGSDVVKRYHNITLIEQENQGAPVARNRGFQESRGHFVIFCDADVIMNEDVLERMLIALLENPEASFAYSAFIFGKKLFTSRPFSKEALFEGNYIMTTSLIRREDFPGFDESLKRFQDWDLWLTMAKQGKTGICISEQEPLFRAIVDGKSRIGTHWLPSFLYRMPLLAQLLAPKQMRKYKEARKVIAQKHNEVSE